MSFKANVQQQEAIENFDCDMLVSAGAGTGKTSVLTRKYLKLLEDRTLSINEIVAITFTDKAAAEMRSRIREGIEGCLLNAAAEDKNYWKGLLELSEQARIMTFHSFCSSLIKEYPLEAGIQPGAAILDSGESGVALKKIIAEVVLQTVENADGAFAEFASAYTLRDLIVMLRDVYLKIQESGLTFADIIALSGQSLKEFNPQLISEQTTEIIIAVDSFLLEFSEQKLTPAAATKFRQLQNDFPLIKSRLKQQNSDLAKVIGELNALREYLKGNWPALIKEEIVNLREVLEEAELALLDNQAALILPLFQNVLESIHDKYREFKLEYGYIDFLDMQLLARDMLKSNESLAEEVRRGIGYLMVDEFQDTNMLQMELVDILISQDQCHWMAVGDVKQSIYRFRGADAGIIVDLRRRLSEQNGKIVPLVVNYRSRTSVIDYVNAVCSAIFKSEGFPYEALEAGQKKVDDDSGIEFLMTAEDDSAAQAELTAARILTLVAKGEYRYSDIVLLVRATSEMEAFQKVFQNYDIPYNMTGGSNFYQRIEIKDQLNFLQAMENPQDESLMLAILTSPFVGLDEATLLKLLNGISLTALLEQTETPPLEGVSSQLQRFYRFRELFQKLQKNLSEMTVPDILRYALKNSSYSELTRLFPDGSQREANVEKLLSIAANFSVKGKHSISGFIEYLEELNSNGAKESDASIQGDENDAVRMLTIHASKGLEFPVVILPRLTKGLSKSGSGTNSMLFHKSCGLAFRLRLSDGESYETSLYKKISELVKREELSESKRLFYVALTRAKNRLILLGSDAHLLREDKDIDINSANSWLRWLRLVHEIPTDANSFSFAGMTVKVTREISTDSLDTSKKLLLNEISPISETTELPELPELPRLGLQSAAVTLSPSMIMLYNVCPRQFFLRFGYRLPEKANVEFTPRFEEEDFENERSDGLGAIIGTFFHFLAENHLEAWSDYLWQQFLSENEISEPQKLESEIKQMWNNYCQSEYAVCDSDEYYDELAFSMEAVPGLEIEGRMDRLIVTDGKLVLVDYKTHRIESEQVAEEAEKYFPQLQLYSLAIKRMFGCLPDRADLFFAYSGTVVSVPLNDDAFASLTEKLKKISNSLLKERNPQSYQTATDVGKCRSCKYAWFCLSEK